MPNQLGANQKIHPISGLLLSGSGLPATPLQQKPRIHASMSSAISPQIKDRHRSLILKLFIEAFCGHSSNREIFIGINRVWATRRRMLADLFKKFQGMNFWKETAGSAAHVIAPKQTNGDTKPLKKGKSPKKAAVNE